MEQGIFDPYYVSEVLADLLSRQRGRKVTPELGPKRPPAEAPANSTNG